MSAYVVLAILAWMKLAAPIPHSEYEVRHVVLLILGALAISTYLHRRDHKKNGDSDNGNDVSEGRE